MGYYDEIAPYYDSFRRDEQLEKARFVKSLIDPKPGESILDVGCGTGLSMAVFESNIIGIDPSKEMLKHNPYKTIHGRAESLPFPNNSFDYVISITAAQNFINLGKAIKEIRRVVKKVAVITILTRSHKASLLRELLNQRFSSVKEYLILTDTVFYCLK